jgi:hypothetical protein
VPRISAFYGIVITMHYREHARPHFRAVYAEHEATIVIATFSVAHRQAAGTRTHYAAPVGA